MIYILGHVVILESGVSQSARTMSECSNFRLETPCPSESCVAYIRRDVLGVRALGKSKCHSDTREPRPHNRISVTIYLYIRLMV